MTENGRESLVQRTDNLLYKIDSNLYIALDRLAKYIDNDATEAARNAAATVSDLTYARSNIIRPFSSGDLDS